MNLRRQTVFLKINTTGLDPSIDRIIEISMIRYTPKEDGSFFSESGIRRFNPGFLMSEESIKIHGIKNEDLVNESNFLDKSQKIFSFIGDSDIIGFGIKNFDILFLKNEFLRCGIEFNMNGRFIIDLLDIYMQMEPRNFENACMFYLNREIFKNTHISDKTSVLPIMFGEMTKIYNDNINTLEDACKITYNGSIPLDMDGLITKSEAGDFVFNLGKHKGNLVGQICLDDKSYFDWIMNKSNFSKETKSLIMKIAIDYKSSIDESFKNEIKKQEYHIEE